MSRFILPKYLLYHLEIYDGTLFISKNETILISVLSSYTCKIFYERNSNNSCNFMFKK